MSEPAQSNDKHGSWLDDGMARHPADADETPDVELWDTPGRDGVVTEDDNDPDRTALRSEIGKYMSLASFPATAEVLAATAERHRAPDGVLAQLRSLGAPTTTFDSPREVWLALGLEAPHRF
jgi:Protein of unknown function (DUF2795)